VIAPGQVIDRDPHNRVRGVDFLVGFLDLVTWGWGSVHLEVEEVQLSPALG